MSNEEKDIQEQEIEQPQPEAVEESFKEFGEDEQNFLSEDTTKEGPELSVEDRARSTGHVSKEEWVASGKDPKQWKSPEEYVRTGELIDKIYAMKSKLDQSDEKIAAVLKYHEEALQAQKNRFKHELENRLQEAKDIGDVDSVEKLTKQKHHMDLQIYQQQVAYSQQEQKKAMDGFVERNKHWFNDAHPELKQRALQLDQEIREYHKAYQLPLTYEQLGRQIEARMRYEQPDIIGTPIHNRPNISSASSQIAKSAANYSSDNADQVFKTLPREKHTLYGAIKDMLKRQGIEYSKKDFIAKLRNDEEF